MFTDNFSMKVNITKRIETPDGRRYCPVVMGPDGRIKADWVIVNGRPREHPKAPIISTGMQMESAGAILLAWMPPLHTEDSFENRES